MHPADYHQDQQGAASGSSARICTSGAISALTWINESNVQADTETVEVHGEAERKSGESAGSEAKARGGFQRRHRRRVESAFLSTNESK